MYCRGDRISLGLAGKIPKCSDKSHEVHPLVEEHAPLVNVGFQCFLRALQRQVLATVIRGYTYSNTVHN